MYIGPLVYLLSISTHLCIVFRLMLLMYGNRLIRRVLPDFNVSQSVFFHTSKYSVFNFFCNKKPSKKSKTSSVLVCPGWLNLPYWKQTCTYRKHLSRLRFKVFEDCIMHSTCIILILNKRIILMLYHYPYKLLLF